MTNDPVARVRAVCEQVVAADPETLAELELLAVMRVTYQRAYAHGDVIALMNDVLAALDTQAAEIERIKANTNHALQSIRERTAAKDDEIATLTAEANLQTTVGPPDGPPDGVDPPVTVNGFLGWGNPGSGDTVSSLDCYGPRGRWERGGRNGQAGDPLADALQRAGCHEGARLVVLAWNRFEPIPETLTIRPAEILGVTDGR